MTTKADTPSPKRSRAVDPQMRPIRWAGKGHSREARLFRRLRAELLTHIGGKPSAVERAMINSAAMLQTHLALLDEKVFADGELSDHASRQYLAWSNTAARTLAKLGLKRQPDRAPTLAEIMASPTPRPRPAAAQAVPEAREAVPA